MLQYGFFNSIEGDRTYDAEDLSNLYEGLLTDGVIRGVASELNVIPGTGMNVTVGTGKAVYDGKWMRNTEPLDLALAKTDNSCSRIDLVIARVNYAERKVEIAVIMGTPAVSPAAPMLLNTADAKEFMLAQILIPKNTTAITESMIQDCRTFTSVQNLKNNAVKYIRENVEVATAKDFLGFQFAQKAGEIMVEELKVNENSVIHATAHVPNTKIPKKGDGYLGVKIHMPPEVGNIPLNASVVATVKADKAANIVGWRTDSQGVRYAIIENTESEEIYIQEISLSCMILKDVTTKTY